MERKKRRLPRIVPQGYTLEAPDGGHAWVVLVGIFFAGIVTMSVMDSLPVIFKELIYMFETDVATLSWLPAIVFCGGQFFGPLATMFVNMYGYQTSVVIGSSLMAFGIIFSYFAPNVGVLLLVYSISGPGLQLCLTSYCVILSQYFKKYFPIGMGVLHASIGASKLCMVPLTQWVSIYYGCRAVFLIIGANMLNLWVIARLFEPIEKHQKLVAVELSSVVDSNPETMPNETTLLTCDAGAAENGDQKHQKLMPDAAVRPKSLIMASSWSIYGSADLTSIQKSQIHFPEKGEDRGCLHRGFCGTIDHSLWREPTFYLICVNNVLMLTLMIFAPFYLYPLAIELGMTHVETAAVVIAKSMADIAGKFLGPAIITMLGLSNQWTYIFLGLVHSVLLTVILVANTFTPFMYLAIVSGFFFGAMSVLIDVLIVECVGVDRYASAIGLGSFVQSFFTMPIPPFMGWIRDTTGNYFNVYLFLALLQVVVAVIWIPLPLIQRASTKKQTEDCKARIK